MSAGDKVYFDDIQRNTLGELAEKAREFLTHNPTRAVYDEWHAFFLAIEPSFYPVGSEEEGVLSQDSTLSQYQDAQSRLHAQSI